MRAINIVARSLAGEFGGALRALDEAHVHVRRRRLAPGTRGLFLPLTPQRPIAGLLLAHDVTAAERERLLTLALGHHLLRHRTLDCYPYLATGPAFDDARARAEAAAFADAFTAALPPARRLRLVR